MKVICKNNSGYYNLTEGNTYEVVELVSQLHTPRFTFPRYVMLKDDNDNITQAHAHRFCTLEGVSYEEYIKEHVKDTYDRDY